MQHGFLKVAAVTPKIQVADPVYNSTVICEKIDEAFAAGAAVLVFPELCITGYTCGDLFWQESLLSAAKEGLEKIAAHTLGKKGLVFVGLPLEYGGKLYNVAAALAEGRVLGYVPKTYIPNYNEFYEGRYFTGGRDCLGGRIEGVPFGTNQLFTSPEMPLLKIAVEICEDLWAPNPPSIGHALAGANVLVNLSAGDEITGKDRYRRSLVEGQSARLVCGYIYAGAGEGESTQDVVYSGHNLIAENGILLAESKRFTNETILAELDLERLNGQRRRMNTFEVTTGAYEIREFSLEKKEVSLTRTINPMPFVPGEEEERTKRCQEILMIQAMGLKKRLEHTHCTKAVVGISGGLDSTLALLVTVKAFDLLGLDRKGIYGVTMPGFGTTDRTYDNAVKLIQCLGTTFREIDIQEAVRVHFSDIDQKEENHDVTYENSQARERTQILMDLANQCNGLVVGTGDLSELALGWATYNGDHMSMYGVNASVPKTLVRHLVRFYAQTCGEKELETVLLDVLDTPVSPELLPPKDGEIAQKTEDLVGPYELHDFYLYYVMRFGFTPKKIFRLARIAFGETYDEETLLKWLKTFYRRFFSQQFKRSCVPDGPKVGSVALSPRGDLRMPSDACVRIWMDELETL